MARTVKCVKLGKELPAMRWKPFQDEFGEKLFQSVSQEGWTLWLEHSKMLINEYRLDLMTTEAQATLREQCEEFFYGDGAQLPPDFVPQKAK